MDTYLFKEKSSNRLTPENNNIGQSQSLNNSKINMFGNSNSLYSKNYNENSEFSSLKSSFFNSVEERFNKSSKTVHKSNNTISKNASEILEKDLKKDKMPEKSNPNSFDNLKSSFFQSVIEREQNLKKISKITNSIKISDKIKIPELSKQNSFDGLKRSVLQSVDKYDEISEKRPKIDFTKVQDNIENFQIQGITPETSKQNLLNNLESSCVQRLNQCDDNLNKLSLTETSKIPEIIEVELKSSETSKQEDKLQSVNKLDKNINETSLTETNNIPEIFEENKTEIKNSEISQQEVNLQSVNKFDEHLVINSPETDSTKIPKNSDNNVSQIPKNFEQISFEELKNSFFQSVHKREKNLKHPPKTKSLKNCKNLEENKIDVQNHENSNQNNTQEKDTEINSKQIPFDSLKNSFLQSVNKREENLKQILKINSKTKIVQYDRFDKEKQTKTLDLLKQSYGLHKKPVKVETPIPSQFTPTEREKPRYEISTKTVDDLIPDSIMQASILISNFIRAQSSQPICCNKCHNHPKYCICTITVKPKYLQKCRNCWKFEKNYGDFISCEKCLIEEYPDINYFCSKNCEQDWWEIEHMAEHLEYELGLSPFNKK